MWSESITLFDPAESVRKDNILKENEILRKKNFKILVKRISRLLRKKKTALFLYQFFNKENYEYELCLIKDIKDLEFILSYTKLKGAL